jgi:hypothetical protein
VPETARLISSRWCYSTAIRFTWKALWPKLKKLEENRDVRRAIEPEEEGALRGRRAHPSRFIYPFLMTLEWTGIRSDEARMLP